GLASRRMAFDPSYAPSFSYAAYWHIFRVGQEWTPDLTADIAEASRLASAAITSDADDAMALASYGYVQSFLKKDYDEAIELIDRSIATSPNCAIAWIFRGATLCFVGDGPNAVRCAETGLRLSPLDKHVSIAEHILAQ